MHIFFIEGWRKSFSVIGEFLGTVLLHIASSIFLITLPLLISSINFCFPFKIMFATTMFLTINYCQLICKTNPQQNGV